MKTKTKILRPLESAPRVIVPGSIYAVVSYPAKLYTWCSTRRAAVVVPAYSIPAGTTCPGAVYHPLAADPADPTGPGIPAVCKSCYAERFEKLRINVRASHDARLVDVADAARAWGRLWIRYGDQMRVQDAALTAIMRDACEATPPSQDPPAAIIWMSRDRDRDAVVAWVWRVVSAMRVGLSRATECACCLEHVRIRWHMGGDIFSLQYASLLRIVWQVLLDLYPTLRIWCPTRNWHDGVPVRVKDATRALASWHPRVNVVASGLHVGMTVPFAEWHGSVSMVVRHWQDVATGYDACHAQTTPEGICGECRTCYVPGARVAYHAH